MEVQLRPTQEVLVAALLEQLTAQVILVEREIHIKDILDIAVEETTELEVVAAVVAQVAQVEMVLILAVVQVVLVNLQHFLDY
jgi:hypothetical protein